MFEVGETIHKQYVIERGIGVGGMGIVYQVYDRLNDTQIALKSLPAPLDVLAEFDGETADLYLTALAREFRMLAGLRHPNIISVLDYGFSEIGQPYLTMELLTDTTSILDGTRTQTLIEKVKHVIQLLQALTYLHQRRVIHLDIKPQNIMLVGDQVKLLDFGLSRALGQTVLPQATINYAAPEVLSGETVDATADLYSVGVVLYQMIAGTLPFSAPGPLEMYVEIQNTSPDLSPIPTELKVIIGRLLAKDPYKRFQNAHQVITALCNALNLMPPKETQAIRESFLQASPFVGRAEELVLLASALTGAEEGSGRVVLVGGESGVGKTRLLSELRINALARGITVLTGQAVNQSGLPYQLWRDAVRTLLLDIEPDPVHASTLKEIVPDIERVLGWQVPAMPILEGPPAQKRLIQAIVDLFKDVRSPTLLILEDIHWSTDDLEVLRQLTNLLADLPLLVVASYRNDERNDLPTRFPDADLLRLTRFNRDEIIILSRSMLGRDVDTNIIDFLEHHTRGNPFFIVEIMRSLAHQAGQLDAINTMALPNDISTGGLMQVLDRRLSQVPTAARYFLDYAAVVGRQLNLPILSTALQIDDDQISRWLYQCADVVVLEVESDRWQFTHDQLRETILKRLTKERKQQINRQLAQAIEQHYEPSDTRDALLAQHWHEAGNYAKERLHALQAARKWQTISSFREIIALVERAFSVEAADDPTTRELMILAGEAMTRSGDYEAADTMFNRCLRQSMFANDALNHARSLYGLGTVAVVLGQNHRAGHYFHSAIEIFRAQNDAGGIARCLNNLGLIANRNGDSEEAQVLRERSLAMFRQADIKQGTADVLNNLGATAADSGQYDQALAYHQESYELRMQLGDRFGIGMSLSNMGMVFGRLGQSIAAHASLEKGLEYYREIGYQAGIAWILDELAMLKLNDDLPDDALPLSEESFAIRNALGSPDAIAWSHKNLGFISLAQTNTSAAMYHFGQAITIWEDEGDQLGLAEVFLGCGLVRLYNEELEDALDTFLAALKLAHFARYPILSMRIVCAIARVLTHAGKAEYAALLYGVLTAQHLHNDVDMKKSVERLRLELGINVIDVDLFDAAVIRGRKLDSNYVIADLLDYNLHIDRTEITMPEIYPHLKRSWTEDKQILCYQIDALSLSLMMSWADDLLDTLAQNRQRIVFNLLFDISAPKASMSFLVLTNRNMLNPGITRTGHTRLKRFLLEHAHMHINLAVVVSSSISGQVAQRYNTDAEEDTTQITAKLFFKQDEAIAWLRQGQSRAGRNTQPLRKAVLADARIKLPTNRNEEFGERDEITLLINDAMVRIQVPEANMLLIGRKGFRSDYQVDVDLAEYGGKMSVSRRHARLEMRNGLLFITDLYSTNGTFVAGKQLSPGVPTMIRENDVIKIGEVTISVIF